ncbi:hypothetical protein X805_12940 [Sphaerotilus natans subsp. natans DSM 6575]|uniref:DUF748 domain-containing protein n=1 Tax=Sphaerotilus natans subsp. natans DSM 6575 TaxID=1286631 RepID=A0A059KNS4_9BURK|nr:DUF748 domain-containing protein [Sphaerotilus natans]KDB53122.1 hypothetical protein X805_12940 [Sphaerotilus natans subsp. natans DSM 6575]SIQ90385.1 Uncharacterized protein involved in outer membrane biogenesis [Sphaerotilus natans]
MTSDAPENTRPHRPHPLLRAAAIALASVLLLWLLLWLALPPLLKSLIETQASQALGRPVTLERVSVRPWAMDLAIERLRIGAAPGAAETEPLLEVARLRADLDAASLWRLAPVVAALEIDAPALRLTRTAEGHYDIDDLIARLSAPSPAPTPDSGPARFALHNLRLSGGSVRFDDRPTGQIHQLDGLTLTLPFLSTLPSQVEIEVAPRLAFTLDGAAFDSQAQGRPFAPRRTTQASFTLPQLDLAPWLGHWPAALPVRLLRGRIGTTLKLDFDAPAGAAPVVRLSGRVQAQELAFSDRDGQPLLGWNDLDIALRDVQPLARRLAFGAIVLDGLTLDLARDAQGRLNLARLAAPTPAAPTTAAASSPPATPDAPAWQVSVEALALQNTRIGWQDATTQPAAHLALEHLTLDTGALAWPMTQPARLKLAAALAAPARGTLGVEGQADAASADLALTIDALGLEAFAPYLRAVLKPRLDGRLAAQARLRWQAGDTPALSVELERGELAALKLSTPDAPAATPPLAALERLEIEAGKIDLNARQVELGRLRLLQPSTRLERDAQGRLNLADWLVASPAAPATPPHSAPDTPGWSLRLGALQLENGRLGWRDLQPEDDVALEVERLQLALQDLQWRGDRLAAPLRWQLAADLRGEGSTRRAGPSAPAIDARGQLALEPLALSARLKLQALPLHLLAPYAPLMPGVELVRARLGWEGDLTLRQPAAGLQLALRGDGRLADLQLHTRQRGGSGEGDDGAELLSWQTLSLQGLDVALQPGARPQVRLRETALDGLFARLMITPEGRFNLRDAGERPVAVTSAPAAASAAASAVAPAVSAPAELPIDLDIGPTRLSRARIDFEDRFIRPNYSADLDELHGQLGAWRSGSREMATLTLAGKVARTGDLSVSGRLQPLASPPALDIQARASDIELAPLSPYSGKYAGYGIERGKLSMDVAYRIDERGRLDATNRLVLKQLTFGEAVDSPDATKLPVRLAVALLSDRHGVIDLDLPIGGSLNDPQFSVFGLVLKVIGNVLSKALTAPFALLSGSSSEDLSRVAFLPGLAQLQPDAPALLDRVARALADRPALTVTLAGEVDRETERAAWQAAALERRLQALHRRELARAGARADLADETARAMTDTERQRLLALLVTQRLKGGVPAGSSATAALAAAEPVDDEDWRELATARAEAVRDALRERGLANERVFVAAPKLLAGQSGWMPQVGMTLSAP